jgi:hypothetical protein
MALEKFNLTDVLTRTRDSLDLTACDVLIAKGKPDSFEFAAIADIETLLASMENIGINAKASPTWKIEDIVKEVDYESIPKGVKGEGSITVVNNNQGFSDFIDEQLKNEVVSLAIVPKGYAANDKIVLFSGIKLTSVSEGKTNEDEAGYSAVLKFVVRARRRSSFERIITIPAA